MTAPVFIGDEISASGFRLAGVEIRTPPLEVGELLKVIESACHHAPLILISSEFAAMLLTKDYERFVSQESPAVLIVPDIRKTTTVEDLNTRLRTQLGILE